jgi:hypothetical protein
MRRRFGDALISVGDLSLLLFMILAISDRARFQLTRLVQHTTTAAVADAGERLSGITSSMFSTAQNQTLQNEAMAVLVVVAAILTIFMIKT